MVITTVIRGKILGFDHGPKCSLRFASALTSDWFVATAAESHVSASRQPSNRQLWLQSEFNDHIQDRLDQWAAANQAIIIESCDSALRKGQIIEWNASSTAKLFGTYQSELQWTGAFAAAVCRENMEICKGNFFGVKTIGSQYILIDYKESCLEHIAGAIARREIVEIC